MNDAPPMTGLLDRFLLVLAWLVGVGSAIHSVIREYRS